ncbi:MAG: cupin domain-containing protein [Candidatus Marinimicrobia bacterium]|nr:cupin domain-containing protein [Candidatus Neomarinimicrobiota bacterium]
MLKITGLFQEQSWQPADGYPAGTQIKVLRDEQGAKTILLKLPPGFFMEAHSHVTTEQHFVLEGSYESEGDVHTTGTYQFIPAGVDHGPFKSSEGALLLVIWDPYLQK